jgi:NAD(P)-dependent dehydrogenase (short-subunit alcohol dehydrogenase family)
MSSVAFLLLDSVVDPMNPRAFSSNKEVRAPLAVITGGSAGLGAAIVEAFLAEGFAVVIVGRDQLRLEQAFDKLALADKGSEGRACWLVADVCQRESVDRLFADVQLRFGRLDVLVNCVGTSDRGRVEDLSGHRVHELIETNVVSALLCSQAALPLLRQSGGVIVNIGSLAAKVGARYLGGYCLAKHALAGLTQQMRLEWRDYGVHVAMVNPGPIQRDDAGKRYASAPGDIPDSARLPAGGAKLKGIAPDVVAQAVVLVAKKRSVDKILPGYLRLLVAIGHAFPRLGDWILLKFTSKNSSR